MFITIDKESTMFTSKRYLLGLMIAMASVGANADVVTYTSKEGNVFEIDGHVVRDMSGQKEYLSANAFFNEKTNQFDLPGIDALTYSGYEYTWANVTDFMHLTNAWLGNNETGDGFEQGNYYNTYSHAEYDPELVNLIGVLGGQVVAPYVSGTGASGHNIEDRSDLAPSMNGWFYLNDNYGDPSTFARGRLHAYQRLNSQGEIAKPGEPYINGVDFVFWDSSALSGVNYFNGSFSSGMLFVRDMNDPSTVIGEADVSDVGLAFIGGVGVLMLGFTAGSRREKS